MLPDWRIAAARWYASKTAWPYLDNNASHISRRGPLVLLLCPLRNFRGCECNISCICRCDSVRSRRRIHRGIAHGRAHITSVRYPRLHAAPLAMHFPLPVTARSEHRTAIDRPLFHLGGIADIKVNASDRPGSDGPIFRITSRDNTAAVESRLFDVLA